MTNEPESVAWNGQGVVTLPTAGTVAEMLERLLGVLKDRGIKVFAVIDHSGEAARVGQSLPNTKLVLFGTVVGLLLGVLSSNALRSLLYNVGAFDPMTFLTVTLALCGVSFLASYIPALRATRSDPMIALGHGA